VENKMKRMLVLLSGAALVACASVQTEPDRAAEVIFSSCDKPVYPAEAVAQQRVGTVTLAFLVAADGTVVDATVFKSSGHRDLDAAARDGIKVCKFSPAIRKGSAVQESTRVQYVWTLK
jgi:bla regulator protein BlaR1